jgi:hypothetical protein
LHETLLSFCRLYLCNNSNNLLNIKLLTILFTNNYLLSDFADQEGGNPEQQVAPAAAHEDGGEQGAANHEDGEQQAAPAAAHEDGEQQAAPAAAHEDGEQQAPAAANREDGEQQAPAATNPRKP